MELFNNWGFYVILYLIAVTIYTQCYKLSTKKLKNAGALTVIIEFIAGLTALIFTPFFELKFPTNIGSYLILGVIIVFATISDRLNTKIMSGLEASTFNILRQLSTTFMIFAGIVFFKEEFVLIKLIGAILIVISNFIIFYQKGKIEFNQYLVLGFLSNIAYTVVLFLQVNVSKEFSLPCFTAINLIIPAIVIMIFEKIKRKDLKEELTQGNKKAIVLSAIFWGISILTQLRAYELGNVSIIAPLCAIGVILNVIVGYILLGEKENLFKKIMAAILIVISVMLIKM